MKRQYIGEIMPNNQKKGARGEIYFVNKLKPIFPNAKRTGFLQAESGGTDIMGVQPFDIEVKYGKSYVSKMIRDVIDQTESEGKKENWKLALIKPHREKAYAIIPFEDMLEILELLKTEEII